MNEQPRCAVETYLSAGYSTEYGWDASVECNAGADGDCGFYRPLEAPVGIDDEDWKTYAALHRQHSTSEDV